MSILRSTLLAGALLSATSALASAPPLSTPADPAAPPALPVEGSPPVLELSLPQEPGLPPFPALPDLPDLPPLPPAALSAPTLPPPGLPSLEGVVDLPDGALHVLELAPPFGAPFPGRGSQVVPEPATGALLALGLLGLAGRGRASRPR